MVQVRNAMQALHIFNSMASQNNLNGRFLPARSIPNLRTENIRNDGSVEQKNDAFTLARSSSQPAEMWVHEMDVETDAIIEHVPEESKEATKCASIATQTDREHDLSVIEKIVLSNRHLVLSVLGMSEMVNTPANDAEVEQLVLFPEVDVPGSPRITKISRNHDSE